MPVGTLLFVQNSNTDGKEPSMAISYIGADVDSKMTNLAVDRSGRIVQEMCVPTTIPSLAAALQMIPRPRKLTFEEGPMAQWLARNLRPHVEELVVCNPHYNALLKEGDKDDVIDARKLALTLPTEGWGFPGRF